MIKSIQDLENIEDNAQYVYYKGTEYIDMNNGDLNDGYIKFNKQRIFKQNTKHLINPLIKEDREYPINNITPVNLEMDFVAVDRDDFDNIVELAKKYLYEQLPKKRKAITSKKG